MDLYTFGLVACIRSQERMGQRWRLDSFCSTLGRMDRSFLLVAFLCIVWVDEGCSDTVLVSFLGVNEVFRSYASPTKGQGDVYHRIPFSYERP